MHILIGLITAIGGLIWALYRLQNAGVDLNSFNPFYWLRLRAWRKKMGSKPLHSLDNSMEAAAVLVVAMAELKGTVTQQAKQQVIDLFCAEFNLAKKSALELYASCSHWLKETANVPEEVKNILAPSKSQFEQRHVESLTNMLETTAQIDGEVTEQQQKLLQNTIAEFSKDEIQQGKW